MERNGGQASCERIENLAVVVLFEPDLHRQRVQFDRVLRVHLLECQGETLEEQLPVFRVLNVEVEVECDLQRVGGCPWYRLGRDGLLGGGRGHQEGESKVLRCEPLRMAVACSDQSGHKNGAARVSRTSTGHGAGQS